MSNKNLKSTGKDTAHALTKGAIGSLPILGSLAAEIFGLVVTPPLEKRRIELLNEIAARLQVLEESKIINLHELAENDQFIDTILQATTYALKTSEKEKITAFRNAIINTAVGDAPEKAISQIYLNQLDKFTVWHIKILKFIDDPKQWLRNAGITPPNYVATSISKIILLAFPEFQDKQDLLDVIWDDLKTAGFHNTGTIMTTMTGDGALSERTTPFGKDFIKFIMAETI